MQLTPHLRRFIAAYGMPLAVLFLLLAIVSAGAATTVYMNPPETTNSIITGQDEFQTGVETSAVVSNNTSLYDVGEKLSDMPVYFYAATPNLTYHIRTAVPQSAETEVSTRLSLHLRATRNGDTFWEYRDLFGAEQATVTDGLHWTNVTVNMSEVSDTISSKRAAIGSIGSFSATHRLQVNYTSTAGDGTLTASAPLVTTSRAYWIDGDLGDSTVNRHTRTETVVGTPDLQTVTLLLSLAVVLVGGSYSVFRRSRTYDLNSIEEDIMRQQFSEWISNGEIPTKSEKEYIRVDSIEDVVDIAIDTNKRVIYDRNLDVYAVVEEDIVYFYTTNTQEVTDWLDI